MSCAGWEERIVADLYEEIEPADREALERHLAACPECRRDREELTVARGALADARPAVPAAPRVVVVAQRASRAASMAVAASLAAVGLVAGVSLSWSWQARTAAERVARSASEPPAGPGSATAATADIEAWVDGRIARALEERGIRPDAATASRPPASTVTRPEVEALLARMEKKLDRGRTHDVHYLLDEMAGVEARTGLRLGQTQEAIRYLAMANDPRISEQ